MSDIYVGTAGWALSRASASRFAFAGTHLERYSRRLRGVEINSCFYRSHLPATYAKWRAATPAGFRFAIKAPRAITHDARLQDTRSAFEQFIDETAPLAEKRGPVLIQLPPSLEFEHPIASKFFDMVRTVYAGSVVCEPRHPTWFTAAATAVFCEHQVSRVAADPARVPEAIVPAGWAGVVYFRLHGSPRMYWSRYDLDYLAAIARTLRGLPAATEAWCVFDNTASGAALDNAWDLRELLTTRSGSNVGAVQPLPAARDVTDEPDHDEH